MEPNTSNTGLDQKTLSTISSTLEKYPHVAKAILFGSRAKGNFKEGSDIDLCLKTDEGFTHSDTIHIMQDFEDSYLPYEFDVLVYKELSNEELKNYIDKVGITIYARR
ncbi:MAG: nucleotidyltransferase domain-containing protein [Treponema sp.]